MALGILQKKKFAKVTSDAASRAKLVLLTPLGQEAQEACFERVGAIEIRWKEQWGANIQQLRHLLEQLLDEPRPAKASPLSRLLAGAFTQAQDAAALSDGDPTRWLPGRQLVCRHRMNGHCALRHRCSGSDLFAN